MRPLMHDRHIQCLSSGMIKKLDYSSVDLLTDDPIGAMRGLENRFYFMLENGCRFTLQQNSG
jgi:hypothetical protein